MIPNRVKSFGFSLNFFYGKVLMIVLHLDSSKSERRAVKFSKSFLAKYKGKNLMMEIKLFQNFWTRNESLQGLAEKTSSK